MILTAMAMGTKLVNDLLQGTGSPEQALAFVDKKTAQYLWKKTTE